MRIFLVLVSISLFTAKSLIASDWIDRCMDLTIHSRFDSALTIAKNQLKQDPQNYRAWFYVAATLNARMVHFENTEFLEKFDIAIDSTIEITNRYLDARPDSLTEAKLLFYNGSALGYRAYIQGRQGAWYSAVPNGLKATGLLGDAVKLDSTLYDAFLGIGTYKYWLFSKLKFITWLPVVPDDREDGISMIRKAMAHSQRSRYMAMHQLIYVLIDFDQTQEATVLADSLMARYPDSQFMWWAATQAWFKHRDYRKARQAYQHLDSLLTADPLANPRHRFKCRYRLAFVSFHLGDYAQCVTFSREALKIADEFSLDQKSDGDIEDIYSMLEECGEKAERSDEPK